MDLTEPKLTLLFKIQSLAEDYNAYKHEFDAYDAPNLPTLLQFYKKKEKPKDYINKNYFGQSDKIDKFVKTIKSLIIEIRDWKDRMMNHGSPDDEFDQIYVETFFSTVFNAIEDYEDVKDLIEYFEPKFLEHGYFKFINQYGLHYQVFLVGQYRFRISSNTDFVESTEFKKYFDPLVYYLFLIYHTKNSKFQHKDLKNALKVVECFEYAESGGLYMVAKYIKALLITNNVEKFLKKVLMQQICHKPVIHSRNVEELMIVHFDMIYDCNEILQKETIYIPINHLYKKYFPQVQELFYNNHYSLQVKQAFFECFYYRDSWHFQQLSSLLNRRNNDALIKFFSNTFFDDPHVLKHIDNEDYFYDQKDSNKNWVIVLESFRDNYLLRLPKEILSYILSFLKKQERKDYKIVVFGKKIK